MAKLGRMEKKVMLSERHAADGIEKARWILEQVDMEGKHDYLELGCGGGHVTRYMAAEHGLACSGTDVDPDMVRHAEARSEGAENVCFMTADATDLPFEDASFDLVLSFGILHHISGWRTAMDEVSRVLRPGGDYVLGDIAYSRLSCRLFKPLMRNYGVYTVDDLVEQAARSGLEVGYRSPPQGSVPRYYGLVLRKRG